MNHKFNHELDHEFEPTFHRDILMDSPVTNDIFSKENKQMTKFLRFFTISFLLVGVTAGLAKAADIDQTTLSKIHQIDTMEIKMAKMALKSSSTPEVKSYATRIVRDHTDADQMVQEVAKKDKISLVNEPVSPSDQKDMQNLMSLTGSDFDVAYQKIMTDGHQKAIKMLTDVRPQLKKQDVRDLVVKLLPNFAHHEALAQELPTGAHDLTRTG
jgi:predicted outer membrane protein